LIDKLRQSDADLVNIALEGKGTDMPAFAGVLSEAEIQQIVDYIRSTQAANQ
jgi:mono/diheme cytochrome c family protein